MFESDGGFEKVKELLPKPDDSEDNSKKSWVLPFAALMFFIILFIIFKNKIIKKLNFFAADSDKYIRVNKNRIFA